MALGALTKENTGFGLTILAFSAFKKARQSVRSAAFLRCCSCKISGPKLLCTSEAEIGAAEQGKVPQASFLAVKALCRCCAPQFLLQRQCFLMSARLFGCSGFCVCRRPHCTGSIQIRCGFPKRGAALFRQSVLLSRKKVCFFVSNRVI